MRTLTDRTLLVLDRASTVGTALALVLAIVCVADLMQVVDVASLHLFAGLAAVVSAWLLGTVAEHELRRRQHEAGHGQPEGAVDDEAEQ